MHHIPRLSQTVYSGMCHEMGTPTVVRIRREVKDIEDTVWRSFRGFDIMTSGSQREGFRLQTSDVDVMVWFTDQKVICDLSQIGLYRIPQHTVILMECEDLPPGFTRLKMITPTGNQYVKLCCVMINGEHFVFGSFFRARLLQDMQNAMNGILRSSIQHGPCATFTFNEIEGDLAFCFRSHHWPNEALPWIQRCQLQNWPLESVLSSIIRDGCHVVPISSEPSNPEKDSEWRISFSRAEQKLVYSMNHCQFLCYGLLKFFLKEVINADANDPCLCSYFMKTVLFWVIQNDSFLDWVPCNLLICFWACFKLLISWVYKGECPNFFMPQNNMFRVKVVGQKQAALFEQLYGLYCKGIPCLLISPTIQKYLEMPILNRTLAFRTSEDSIISEVYLDLCLFSEIVNRDGALSRDTPKVLFPKILNLLEQLQKTHLTSFKRVAVQYYLSFLFRYLSWILLNQNVEILSNKNNIHIYKRSLTMMKLAVKIGCVSEMLHLSMFYYNTNQYERSLSCLQKAQGKMSKPYVLYHRYVNEEFYRRAMAGVSLGDRMRKCLIIDIILTFDIAYIDELILEQTTTTAEGSGNLVIPPFVMLHMLFVLNHQRLGNTVRSQQSIQDLHTLLLFDDWTRVPADCRDISWQILGICQQISGDYVEALNSFQCSLQQIPRHRIQEATMSRIRRMYE